MSRRRRSTREISDAASPAAGGTDPRRRVPRTDALLAGPAARAALSVHRETVVRAKVREIQQAVRTGALDPGRAEEALAERLESLDTTSMHPVLNATGVVVHTNLGRAPLSAPALEALQRAAGYVDVELDLSTGRRAGKRGAATVAALLAACPAAEDAVVVNNGAAGLLLSCAALAGGGEAAISRGELIEIGAGFRLPELIESAHVSLHEIGATNRTHPADYAAAAARPDARAILKVHPSNYRVEGFTAGVDLPELRRIADEHDLALIADVGSGLLTPDPAIPDEPDVDTALRQGADVVIASGDKLLGGPQAGVLLGRAEAITRLRRHPLYRALRMDKLRFAALEATVAGSDVPVVDYLHADPGTLRGRAEALAAEVGGEVVAHDGRVGGGGAPGVPLPGWAVRITESPEELAAALRAGDPAVLARVHEGAVLIDPRCVPAGHDAELASAVRAARVTAREA